MCREKTAARVPRQLDWAERGTTFRPVLGHREFRAWWFAGFALLAMATVTHTLEHAEIALVADCIAHNHADGADHDGGSRHDHGCLSHDHAPAVFGAIFALTVVSTVSGICAERFFPPSAVPASIDHPPQLS